MDQCSVSAKNLAAGAKMLLAAVCEMFRRSLALIFSIAMVLYATLPLLAEEPIDYLEQIKPILQARCYACHGALKQEAGLRLDTASLAKKGGESGPAVVPGDLIDSSTLLKRIAAANGDERMPPLQEGEPLTTEQVAVIRRWIADGAKAPADEQPEADPNSHWAFQPIVRPPVPIETSAWIRNPIDAFLHQQHQKHGLTPQPEAPRIIQLRRLHLDIIGIPPTPDEIAACESDSSPQWYEQTVTRLLADPRHGERWARHWMDIWRYSDWWGLGDQLRNSQKHIWHWRDWIVESLNDNTPYDEMVRLMLAADELHPDDISRLRATGYLARNYWLFNRPQWMEETVEHVSKGFLGLTVNCARCHDHKYDPIAQTDYYRLRAFFEPYHVRLDVVPGQPDLAKDGIPRVFDGLMDEPTYLYVRGDERNPDKSEVISPGVPSVLSFNELSISPVTLPAEAWQPERRPWVIDAHLSEARRDRDTVESALQKAREKLHGALLTESELSEKAKEHTEHQSKSSAPLISERFETLDAARWKTFGGDWVHTPGKLEQKKDGATTSFIRFLNESPRDFDVSVRMTILGGSQWRSAGISFDATQEDPTQPATADVSEQTVYVSAFAGGSKVQAASNSGGVWQYPGGDAVRVMALELNQTYTLRVLARGTLINAFLDDELVISLESPLPRRDGSLQLMTYDAIVAFHEVTISPLDPSVSLWAPGADPLSRPQTLKMARAAVATAESELRIAEASLTLSRAEFESTERLAEAQRAEWDPADSSRGDKAAAAIRAVRQVQVARAVHSLVIAEQTMLGPANGRKDTAEKALNDAKEAMAMAVEAVQAEVKPEETFPRFKGASWTPTRFFDSGKDDPEIKFLPTSTGRRAALASWITDRRNPLTARVAVNHIWTRHMGQPLVPTMFDFGRKGTPPANPDLLDWLAAELIDSGWNMKHLHSLIANSAAFHMSSSMSGAESASAKDPENQFWWRRVPLRRESQLIRDSMLSMAGTLDQTMGGPSVPADQQQASTRRSLYFFHSNNDRSMFLTTFDEALVKDCYRREQSIVPQQALALSNSQLALDAAKQIARRLSEGVPDEATFVRDAFRVITGINPGAAEIEASVAALETWRKLPGGTAETARANLVWTLINHNDFVTLR